jgi:hypothetical protein
MDPITRTTELEAINEMLRAIGESPVSTVDSGNSDVTTALDLLRSHSRRVQAMGWHFNTDREYTLTPDGEGYLNVPSNALKIDSMGDSATLDVVQRGTKLYDKKNKTFVFSEPMTVDMVVGLNWDELPESARAHIISLAGLEFVDTDIGSDTRHQFTAQRVSQTRVLLETEETDNGDFNMLTNSYSGLQISDRRL